MLKLGVYSIDQLRSGKVRSLLGRRKRVAIQLLNEIDAEQEYDSLFDIVVRDLTDDRGAFKRTSSARFTEFDQKAAELLHQSFPNSSSQVAIHDVAVSNARTAVDFYHVVTKEIADIDYLATDYDPALTVVKSGSLSVVLSSRNSVVQVVLPPFVFTPKQREHPVMYPINLLVAKILQVTTVKRLVDRYLRGEVDDASIERVELFCPAAKTLANSSDNFHLGTHNLLEPMDTANLYSCVRAMNVLNRNYFNAAQLSTVLSNIAASLTEGGLLIAGSNQESDTPVQGGIYCLSRGRFEPMYETGGNDFLIEHISRFNSLSQVS